MCWLDSGAEEGVDDSFWMTWPRASRDLLMYCPSF
jgi:hypothetical protein